MTRRDRHLPKARSEVSTFPSVPHRTWWVRTLSQRGNEWQEAVMLRCLRSSCLNDDVSSSFSRWSTWFCSGRWNRELSGLGSHCLTCGGTNSYGIFLGNCFGNWSTTALHKLLFWYSWNPSDIHSELLPLSWRAAIKATKQTGKWFQKLLAPLAPSFVQRSSCL